MTAEEARQLTAALRVPHDTLPRAEYLEAVQMRVIQVRSALDWIARGQDPAAMLRAMAEQIAVAERAGRGPAARPGTDDLSHGREEEIR